MSTSTEALTGAPGSATHTIGRPSARPPRSRDTEPSIVASGLRCSYGATEAVRGIDLEIAHGEIFALLGPNGAGKTTTVEILEGFRRRTAGEVPTPPTPPTPDRGGARGSESCCRRASPSPS